MLPAKPDEPSENQDRSSDPIYLDTQALYASERCFRAFMGSLGLDLTDPHLSGTAERVARMFSRELLHAEPFDFRTFPKESDSLVVVRDIPFFAVCAHHFVPFRGTCAVGYVPRDRQAGLSKLARAVDYCARCRPQIQERLVQDIADMIEDKLRPLAVGVYMEAEHLCMAMRGVQKEGTMTVTSCLRGALREDDALRAEFMSMIGRAK